MADLAKFTKKDRRPCYVLRVAGLDVLYGTHAPFSLQTNGITHAGRASIVANGMNFSRRIDENARVVEVGNLQITLSSDESYSADAFDAGKVFGRIGYQGADKFSRVEQTVDAVGSSVVVADNSAFSPGERVHVGLETMTIASLSGSDTLNVSRGVLGTVPRVHRVDAVNGSYPYLTMPLTYFRGRRVVVYEGRVDESGSVSSDIADYIEVFRGFIAAEPATATTGMSHEITLELAPLTAVLDKPLPSRTSKTKLHTALHAFDGTVANKIVVTSFHKRGQMYESVSLMSHSGANFKLTDSNCVDIPNRFDNDLAAYHPRGMRLEILFSSETNSLFLGPNSVDTSHNEIENFYPSRVLTDLIAYHSTFNLDGLPFNVQSAPTVESKVCNISILGTRTAPQVAAWKNLVSARFNATFSPGTLSGLSGFLFDVDLDPNGGEIFIDPNFSRRGVGSVPAANLILSNSPQKMLDLLSSQFLGENFLVTRSVLSEITSRVLQADSVTGANAPVSGSDVYRNRASQIPIGHNGREPNQLLPFEALELDDPDGNPRVFEVSAQRLIVTDGGQAVPTRLADGWLHLGSAFNGAGESVPLSGCERFVVFESTLGLGSSSGTVAIEKEDELIALLELSGETSVSNEGFSGYQYQIDKVIKFADVATVADIPGEKRHTVRSTISPSGTTVGALILKLLLSTNGQSKSSSTYDVFSIGAGLSDATGHSDTFGADVDLESFTSIPNPITAETFAPIYKEGDTLLETIEGLLALVNYTVDISTDELGNCRLRAVEIGLPNSSDITRDFVTSDISSGSVPTSDAELSIKNVFNFSANYNHEGDPDVELTVRDQVSIDLFNQAETMSVDLKGVKINTRLPGDAIHALRPVFARLRIENSFPRRVFSLDVAASLLQQIALGDTCTITHPLMRGTSGLGVTSEPARVRSVEYDAYSPTGTIELISYGTTGQSWNMAATIVSVASNIKLTVNENDHSPENRPSNGEEIEDSTAFFVGQKVEIYSAYDLDSPLVSSSVVNISSDGNQITVGDSCAALPADSLGLGFVGFIVADDYANGDAAQKYAYIGRTTAT